MINYMSNAYNRFLENSTSKSFEHNLVRAVYARKNQLKLDFSNLYPTVGYVSEQRNAIHVISIVLICYRQQNFIYNQKPLTFKKYNINESWPT